MNNALICTKRTELHLLKPVHAEMLLHYRVENKKHLQACEPKRSPSYYTLEQVIESINYNQKQFETGSSFNLVVMTENNNEIIGLCHFSNIVYGVFQACNLGYSLAEKYQGHGYMQEVLVGAVEYIFNELKLNRIMANHLPSNDRSAKLLERLGFENEGLAKSYLKINGQWQDHVLTAKLNPRC